LSATFVARLEIVAEARPLNQRGAPPLLTARFLGRSGEKRSHLLLENYDDQLK
jgi:hypothetical protein